MNEERLFELLIAKMRIREEKEAATADMQQQLETDNAQLKRENQSLRGQGKIYEERLLSMEAESKSQECRMTSWKKKIARFKEIINELGHDFEALRLDSDRLKATTLSLQDERHALTSSIDVIKLEIVRAEGTIDDQRMGIVQYEKQVAGLEQALLASRDQLEESISSLANEKKRTNTLESYIQNYSRSQIRQVNLLREDHAKLLEKLMSRLEDISESSTNTRDVVLSEIRTTFEECRDSVRELGERCSAETRDVQDSTNTIHDVAAR
jgi:chromosome segregation ATPase